MRLYKGRNASRCWRVPCAPAHERVPYDSVWLGWHPYAIDPEADYASEPTTLVELALTPVPEGTLLTVTEAGFDRIPAARRAKAFEMNGAGWAQQMENLARHVHA